MKPDDVYQFFGSANKAAKAIKVTGAAFYRWTKIGYIPITQQQKFQSVTKHALIARLEDARIPKKSREKYCTDSQPYYLPLFRYYDKKHGMCDIETIHFRKGKHPQIMYIRGTNKREKYSVFTTQGLMQAINLLDEDSNMVYEGDICLLKSGEKFIVKDMSFAHKLKKSGKFKIIGNVYEK